MTAAPPPRRATLSDVAAAAGVSKATVSKALNGRDDVSRATRERVLATVAELGYHSSALTAAPVRRALAVTFDIPASAYVMTVLEGVLAAAADQRLDLLTRLPPDRAHRTERAAARAWVADQRASGAIGVVGLTLSRPDVLLDAATEAQLPFVMVDPVDTTHPRLMSVASSNWAGARDAADYLIALGHRRIAWIGGSETSDAERDRRYGYRAALDAAGIASDPDLVVSDRFDAAVGGGHAARMLGLSERPTAIMAGDDEIAVGVLAAARELRIDVPTQLSVTGFDDTPQAAWTTPPLTTVRQHMAEMGRMAVQSVVGIAAGLPPVSRHVELATSLSVRGTTAPPPADALS